MDLELVKFINSDLTWNAVKKGHRSTIRRPRKPAASTSEFDYEKSGVAILGQHFGEEVLDVPIKKRILMLQSPSLSNEKTRSKKSKTGSSTNNEQSKLIKKEVPDLNDFSGIELLAAAACHSSVYDNSPAAPMESSAVEEHTTKPRVVESYTDIVVKDDVAPIDSADSSVQDPVTQNVCDNNGNGEGDDDDKRPVVSVPVASKDVRFHWDLNTVMDDWEEEPCCDILVDPHSEKAYLKEGYETTNSQVTESQQEVKSEGRQAVSEVVQDDDKVTTSEDRLSDCCGSNTIDKAKAGGYDSPVEDGELRGDTWQKNEVEELECVDYESDNIYEDNFDTVESVDNGVVVLPNSETEQQDDDKKNVPSISNQLPEHSQGAISEEKDTIPSFGVRKNDASIHRSRSENIEDCYSRGKRDFGQEKSTGRGGWDSRNTHTHSNSHRYYPSSRPKHVIGGSSVRERDTHLTSYNNNNSRVNNYKTFNTRPERNEPYGAHNRGFIRDKYKGGLGFHLQGSRREEHNGSDSCHSERKVSSFSSGFNRGAHVSRSRRRSRSRSRSESPIAWNFQKKRNVDTKRESPDHRADVRFQGGDINSQYRDRRASPALGRLKSSDHFGPTSSSSRSGRYPPQANGGQYDDRYGGGHFRYHVRNKDNNGFRYNNSRNENRYFKDSVGDGEFHKGDLQRE